MRYQASFYGRKLGALGITYAHTIIVEADSPDAARLKCYDTHEHIAGGTGGIAVVAMPDKRYTMRDENGQVVAGLENVEGDNALLTMSRVSYDRAIAALEVGETAHGTYRDEQYWVTRTA